MFTDKSELQFEDEKGGEEEDEDGGEGAVVSSENSNICVFEQCEIFTTQVYNATKFIWAQVTDPLSEIVSW